MASREGEIFTIGLSGQEEQDFSPISKQLALLIVSSEPKLYLSGTLLNSLPLKRIAIILLLCYWLIKGITVNSILLEAIWIAT